MIEQDTALDQADRATIHTDRIAKADSLGWASVPALLRLMAMHPARLSISAVSAILAAGLSLAPHAAFGWIISGNKASDLAGISLTIVIGGLLAALIARNAFAAISTSLSHFAAFDIIAALRHSLTEKLAVLPLGFIQDDANADLKSLVIKDVETLEDGVAHLIPEMTSALIVPAIVLVVLAILDWRIAFATVIPTLLGFILIGVVMRKTQSSTANYYKALGRVAADTGETIDAMPTVRAFNQVDKVSTRAGAAFENLDRVSRAWMRQALVPMGGIQLLLTSPLLLAMPVGLALVAAGSLEPSIFATQMVFALGMGDIFSSLTGLTYRLSRQGEAWQRIDKVLTAPQMKMPGVPEAPEAGSITFRDVSFSYGGRQALQSIDLDVLPGSCLALVGASGSGKTTIFNLIARFWDVSAGAVMIGGCDVRDMDQDTHQAQFALVSQAVVIFHGTIAENIKLARPGASDAEVEQAARAAQAHAFISRLPHGYDTLVGDGGTSLSGGERQRLSLARAFLKNASILLLDEATSFADALNEVAIQEAVSNLCRGRTMMVIAHRLTTIVQADEIIVLDRGRIVERGTHARLLQRGGQYAAMWRAQDEASRFRFSAAEAI